MNAPASLIAVTVHQPWSFLLAAGYKPLENRDWLPTNTVPLGAWMAIHAGMKFDPAEVKGIIDDLQGRGVLKFRPEHKGLSLKMLMDQCGHILSVGRLAGVVTQSASPYFVGKYGWVFDPMVQLPTPVIHRGAQGLWPVSPKALPIVRQEFLKARPIDRPVKRFDSPTLLDGVVAVPPPSADSAAPSTGEPPCP
jgi:hypothetical protein